MVASLPWYLWAFLFIIFILQVINLAQTGFSGVGAITGGDIPSLPDIAKLKASAQTNITIIMVISTVVLALAAYFFLSNNPAQERPYVILMLHASVFISTISASMAIMNQLSSI